MKNLEVIVAMRCLNDPEHRAQPWSGGLNQKLHFLGMFNPSFPAVARLDGLKADASGQLTAAQRVQRLSVDQPPWLKPTTKHQGAVPFRCARRSLTLRTTGTSAMGEGRRKSHN